MANVSENKNLKDGFYHWGLMYESGPVSIKEALANGELPKEWLTYFEKWCQWAKESDGIFNYLKSAYSIFEYNGKLYKISGSTFGIEDYQFEHIERCIAEDLVKLGAKRYFYHGMLD